jgi:hypothetical protein
MASMNYCFTVCCATDDKVQRKTLDHMGKARSPMEKSQTSSFSAGVYFFGRFLTFGLPSASTFSQNFLVKASTIDQFDEKLF